MSVEDKVQPTSDSVRLRLRLTSNHSCQNRPQSGALVAQADQRLFCNLTITTFLEFCIPHSTL